jgi:hypothetical protein
MCVMANRITAGKIIDAWLDQASRRKSQILEKRLRSVHIEIVAVVGDSE